MSEDCVQRFLFDGLDVRGAVVRLGPVWQQLLANRHYPAPVVELLGQMCAMTALLTDNLKQAGRLTIQLRGQGPVSLLVIDCSTELNLRCMAQHEATISAGSLIELLGAGQLMLSLDTPAMRVPYQSVVPLVGNSIAEIFEHYLGQSEQIASRFFLAATATGVAGLFLQKMPATEAHDADGWARCTALAGTVKDEELLNLPSEELLTRLFHQESVRVFAARPVSHEVPEDWEKMRNMLRTLGREEVYAAVKRLGAIVIRDDLGNREYRFDKAAIDALFSNTPETPPSVH